MRIVRLRVNFISIVRNNCLNTLDIKGWGRNYSIEGS